MKKVGKEFRKSLSAILAAAMVVSSMPETSLVANAEEVDAQQQSYELGDEIVDNGESAKFAYKMQAEVEKDNAGKATATVKYLLGWDHSSDNPEDYTELKDSVDVKETVNPYIKVEPKEGYTIDRVYFYTSDDVDEQALEVKDVSNHIYSIPAVSGGVTVTIVVETSHITIEKINAKLNKSGANNLTVKDVNNSDKEVTDGGALTESDAHTLDFTVAETDNSNTYEVKSVEVTYGTKKLTAQLVDSKTGKYQVDLNGVYGEEADDKTVDLTVKVTQIAKTSTEFSGESFNVVFEADEDGVVIDDITTGDASKLDLNIDGVKYAQQGSNEKGKLTVDLSLDGGLASNFVIDQVKIETVKSGDNKKPSWDGTDGFVAYKDGGLSYDGTLTDIESVSIIVKVKKDKNVIYVKDDNNDIEVNAVYAAEAPSKAIADGDGVTTLPGYINYVEKNKLYLSFSSKEDNKQFKNAANVEQVKDSKGNPIENLYLYNGTISATTDTIVLRPTTEAVIDELTIKNDDKLTADYRVVDKAPSYDDAVAAFAGTTGKVTEKTVTEESTTKTVVEAERDKYLIVRVRDGIEVEGATPITETSDSDYDYYQVQVASGLTLKYAIKTYTITFDGDTSKLTELKYKYSTDADTDASWKPATSSVKVKENSTINFKWEPKKVLGTVNKLTYTIGEDEVTEYGEVSQLPSGTVTGNDKFEFDVVVDDADVGITGFNATSVNRVMITTADTDNTYKISNDKAAITNAVTSTKGYYVASGRDLYVQVTLKDNKKTATGLTLGGASTGVTLVSENLFKIAAANVTNGALAVTDGTVANSIKVTNDTTNKKVKLYYQVGGDWVEAASTVPVVSGSSVTFKAEIDSADQNKYMLSSYKVNDKDTEYLEAGLFTKVFTVPVLENGKATVNVESEALARDITFKWSEEYNINIDAANVVKYSEKKEIPTTPTSSGAYVDGTDKKNFKAGDIVTVRALHGKTVRFSVDMIAEKEVKTVTLSPLTDKVTTYSDGYAFAPTVNATVDITTGDVSLKPMTFKVAAADVSRISKIYAYVGNNGKAVESKKDARELSLASNGEASVNVYPGENLYFEVEMADENYTVSKIRVDSKDVAENSLSYTYADVKKDDAIYLVVGENTARYNTATLQYTDATISVTDDSTTSGNGKLDKEKTTVTVLPGTATSNTLRFTATPKTGYKIESITIDGEEYTLVENAPSQTVVVDFGSETVKKDNKEETVAKSGQNKLVKIVTVAKEAEADKRFKFALDGFGADQNKVSVDVTAASGVTDNGKTGSNKIYTVDAKSASEVFVTVTAPIKYKITGTDAGINAVIEQGSSVSEKDQTVSYKFKINVSALTNAVAADKTTINPADVITFTGTIGKGELTISGAKLIKDADNEFISGSNQFFKRGITKGTKYVVVYDSYETLQIADGVKLDAAGNKTSEINWVDVTDFQEVDGNKETTITVTEDSAEYQVVNKNLTAYTVTATGSSVVNQTGINDETGILNAYTVKGGETVDITVTYKDELKDELKLKAIEDLSANTKVKVNGTGGKYTIETSAKDAGKTFTFDIVNTESVDGVSKDKLVTSFTLTIAPATATATAKLGDKVVENDSTIQIEAGTKTVLDVTYSSDIATGLLAVTPNTGAFQAYYDLDDKYETDYSKLVLDASDMKAGATSTVAVKYDGKTIYSFKVEAKAPKLALKSFTVPNGGSTYVNVDMVPESITVSNEYTNAYYYEVYVKPTGTTTATGAKTGYYYIPVDPKWDADYKTYTFGEQAKQITVNTASKDTDTYAGTYELTARLVISNADIDETKLFSSVPSSVVAGGETLTATAATTAPKFEQNLKVKQTLKTMYTGQTAEVAELIYSDDTSYVANVSYEILNADGSQLNSDKVATPSGKLKITVPAKTKAGTYTVNVYSENSESKMIGKTESTKAIVQSKASFKIKVVSGINWIDAYVPATITQTGKKNVSVSVKATGYSDYWNVDKPTKAKTQKFTYEIVNYRTGAAKKNIDENVSISSSGKLVISKNFAVNANAAYNKFTVRITAADFEGNTAVIYRDVEVTSEAKELSSITLVDENGKALGDSVDFAQIDKGVYVKVKDTNNKEVALNDVKLTPSSGNVYITEDWNDEGFVGFKLVRKSGLTPKKTTLTVKATTTDGGKKTVKAKFTLTPADGKYVVAIEADNAVEKSANNWTISNRGGKIWVNVFDGNHIARKDIYNYSVSVKGGKILFANDNKDSYQTCILPSAQEVKITLTDKTTKEKQVITVFDNTYPTTKAPKFSLVKGEKLSANLRELQVLDYNVSSADYDAVYITQISSPKNVWAHTTYNGDYMNADGSYKIDDNGQFHISFRETSAKAGTLQYQATFGNYKDGIFVPATKPAKFNVKISKSQKIAVEENYTLNYAYKNYVELKGNQGFTLVELQNKNIDGKSNNFNTFFKISGNKIVLDTASLIASGKIKDVADIEKLVGSEDLSGYVKVSYTTGWDITRYCYNTAYAVVPVTIALSAEALAYTFTSSPVIASSTVYVDTKVLDANGKAIAFVTDSKSDVSTSTERASISAVGKNADKENIVTLRYTGAATAGTYPITYKILPEGSYYADFAKAKGASYAVGKYGVDVTGNITAMDASATGLLTVNEDKQSINLADSSTDQAWVTSGKTKYGTYKAYLKLEDLFKNVDDDKIKTLSNDEKIASVSTTEAKVKKVELDKTGSKVRLAVTITSDNLDLTTVPVTFTTTHGASQVVNIAVKSTSQYTISQVGDLVKTYLEGLTYSSTMTSAVLKAGIEAKVTENGGNAAASGIEVVSVSTPESTGSENNAYNVEVTLRSKTDSTNTATVTATITTAYKKVKFADIVDQKKAAKEINDNVIDHILNQGDLVGTKKYSDLDSDVKAQYYEVTADTTKAAIKTFIETRLSQLYSDADKYVVNVPTAGYNYEAAQLYEDGKVTFCYIIKDAKGNEITGKTISRKFDMTRKPVAEETK